MQGYGAGSANPDRCDCQYVNNYVPPSYQLPVVAPPKPKIEVSARCIGTAGIPVCDGAPPVNYLDACSTSCGTGHVDCAGACDAPAPPANLGAPCVAGTCSCGDIPGVIGCAGTCEATTVLTKCCLFCGFQCPLF